MATTFDAAASHKTNAVVAEILGLDPDLVTSLTITFAAGNLPSVTVSRMLMISEAMALAEAVGAARTEGGVMVTDDCSCIYCGQSVAGLDDAPEPPYLPLFQTED